jgi:hypothetical protein
MGTNTSQGVARTRVHLLLPVAFLLAIVNYCTLRLPAISFHFSARGEDVIPASQDEAKPYTYAEPRIDYRVLTLQSALDNYPERRENVERMVKDYGFKMDLAIDGTKDIDKVNEVLSRHFGPCMHREPRKLGRLGLWASTLLQWEEIMQQSDNLDFVLIAEDDHIYSDDIHEKVKHMVHYRWKYFPGENTLPMYSFGHGDGINLYQVSALPGLLKVARDEWNSSNGVGLDVFFDSKGLATENPNFAWSTIIMKAHKNSTLESQPDAACVNGTYVIVEASN